MIALLIPALASAFWSESNFTMTATPIEVVAGGPVAFDVKVVYHGAVALRHWTTDESMPHVTAGPPRDWFSLTAPKKSYFSFGGPRERDIKAGDTVTSRKVWLHQLYPGPAPWRHTTARLTWEEGLNECENVNGYHAGRLTLDVPVRPEPFGPHVVERLRGRLHHLRTIGRTATGYMDAEHELANLIIGTNHAEFVPVAFDLLRLPCSGNHSWQVEQFILGFPQHADAIDTFRLDRALAEPAAETGALGNLLDEWWRRERSRGWPAAAARESLAAVDGANLHWLVGRQTPRPVAAATVARLARHASPWLRACLYLCLPDRVGGPWVEALLADLREDVRPIPADELARKAADLGAPSFRTREAAEDHLTARAGRTVAFLTKALEDGLSPEAARRAQRVLDRAAATPPEPYQARCADWLSSGYRCEAGRKLVAVLEAGDPHCPAVKAVRTAKK